MAFLFQVYADECEPAWELAIEGGKQLHVCGFEDQEVKGPKGARAFADFTIREVAEGKPAREVFRSEESETYWLRALGKKGFEIEELWFFSDKPQPGIRRELNCTADVCTLSEPRCVYKGKSRFPKALAELQKRLATGGAGEDGEELIDQIFAQALSGDSAAREFFTKAPQGMVPALKEVFEGNRKKLAICR